MSSLRKEFAIANLPSIRLILVPPPLLSQRRTCRPPDGSMILPHKIVEIFYMADDGRSPVLLIVAANGHGMGLATINGNLLGYTMPIAIEPIATWRPSEYCMPVGNRMQFWFP